MKSYILKPLIFFILWMWCASIELFYKKILGISNLGIIMAICMIGAFAIPYYMNRKGEA